MSAGSPNDSPRTTPGHDGRPPPGCCPRPSTGSTCWAPSRRAGPATSCTCPLLYRFRTIDKLPEEPFSRDAVRGTVVHKVLEDLFDLPAAERTPERAARPAVPAWDSVLEAEPRRGRDVQPGEGDGRSPRMATRPRRRWLASCRVVLDRYFTLEDPRRLEPAERELYVEALLDSKLLLRGFVDRIDVAPDGAIRVVDYKTGRSPGECSRPRRCSR